MKSMQDSAAISSELKSALHKALEDLSKGRRDPEAAKRAADRMDRMREENRRASGELNVAVGLIRETRERR